EQEGASVMMDKVVHDAAAYSRSIARQRGRNEQWAESIVRESISTPAREALELKVIDLIADDEADLLAQLDGRTYLRHGEERTLHTRGVVLQFAEMTLRQKILNTISNPNVAYMLMMLGILGIFFEISQPGSIFPGAIGAIALLLAFFGLQTLPVNFAGVLLIGVALVLFILEIKVTSYGMLTVGGIIAMTLGSLMLIDSSAPFMQISRVVIAATVGVVSSFFLFVMYFVVRTQRTRFVSGQEGMAGELGTAVTAVGDGGRVFVHGEYWDAFAREPIAAGEAVEVVRMDSGLRLEVRRATPR
ncbi:MAG: nodulation protein NfeD, partial [Desulfuromonadales bacterium]|nr:nodulation protein NfeD [Desulfuromonadales bacterium]